MKSKTIGKPIALAHGNSPASFQLATDGKILTLPYHFHEEAELIFIRKGTATIFIGNYVNNCKEGDVFFVGKNLPHAVHQNEATEMQDNTPPELVSLQFKEEFLGDRFFMTKELLHIEEFFKRSTRGLKLDIPAAGFYPLLLELQHAAGVPAIAVVLNLLNVLAKTERCEFLNTIHFGDETHSQPESDKINKVFSYTEEHYRESISLAQIAALINFTETSFCRYFKLKTGKNYFQYLNEIRIGNACRILLENINKDIEEVCFTCGFNNPSTFYKQFKKIVKLTPKEYQLKGSKRFMINTMVA